MTPVELVIEGPAKNALGRGQLEHLRDSLRGVGDAPILLRGAGDSFSAGLNLKELASFDAGQMRSFLELLADVVEGLFRHPGPTVACVNGHAIAGGAILAAATDHRIATTEPSARFGLNEVALGLRFPPSVLQIVRYRVARFEAAVLGGELVDPVGAAQLGLVDALADDPLEAARVKLAALSAHPRAAYVATKRDLRGPLVTRDTEAERRFTEEVLPVWTSDELKARIRSFLGGRR